MTKCDICGHLGRFLIEYNFLYFGVLLRNANNAFSSDVAVVDSQLQNFSIEQKNYYKKKFSKRPPSTAT